MAWSIPDRAWGFESNGDPIAGRTKHWAAKDRTEPWPDVLLPDNYVKGDQHKEKKAEDVLDKEEEETVGDVDLRDDKVKSVREEADKSQASDQHRGRLVGGWWERGTAETEGGREKEKERTHAGRQDEGDTEWDVVEEIIKPGLDSADGQLLFPGGSNRHHLFSESSVNIVQHLNAKNLRDKTLNLWLQWWWWWQWYPTPCSSVRPFVGCSVTLFTPSNKHIVWCVSVSNGMEVDKVTDEVANMMVNMVADMEMDKVADMVADMIADMVAGIEVDNVADILHNGHIIDTSALVHSGQRAWKLKSIRPARPKAWGLGLGGLVSDGPGVWGNLGNARKKSIFPMWGVL